MKLTINTNDLRNVVNNTVINSKSTLDVLQHALFEVCGNKALAHISVSTSNEVETLTTYIEGVCNKETAAFTASVQQLKAALFGIDDESVVLNLSERQLSLIIGRRKYKIQTLPANIFPKSNDDNEEKKQMDIAALREGLQSTQYCRDKTNDLTIYSGICFDVDHVVALDGRRCAVSPCRTGLENTIVIPGQAVSSILKNLIDGCNFFVQSIGETVIGVRFATDAFSLTVRTRTETYPNWKAALIDIDKADIHTVFNGNNLASAIKRVTPFSLKNIDGKKWQRIAVASGENKLAITCLDGSADDYAECINADEFNLEINAMYLTDMLAACGQNEITWHANSAERLQAFTSKDSVATHFIMPMGAEA